MNESSQIMQLRNHILHRSAIYVTLYKVDKANALFPCHIVSNMTGVMGCRELCHFRPN